MVTTATVTKKRKAENGTSNGKVSKKKNGSAASLSSKASSTTSEPSPDEFKPYTLAEIRTKISELSNNVPEIPENGIDPDNKEQVRQWATEMQAIIEQFNLLLCCVSSATYKWGTDRTGAADQHLGLLSSELGNAQDQISSTITPRITNVLAPVVDLVTKESITTKLEDGSEKKVNYFAQEDNDPSFIRLCAVILSRNAVMLRQVLLTNFNKVGRVINDYLKATKKDGQNSRNSFAY